MTEIEGVGNIMVQGSFWNTPAPLLIRNVLYAPGLTNNLLSGGMLTEAGLEGKLHESGLDLYNQTSGELHLRMSFLRGMPRVVLRPVCSPGASELWEPTFPGSPSHQPVGCKRGLGTTSLHWYWGKRDGTPLLLVCSPDSWMQMQLWGCIPALYCVEGLLATGTHLVVRVCVPEGATAAVLKSDLGCWASPQSIQGASSPQMAESMVTLGVDTHHQAVLPR